MSFIYQTGVLKQPIFRVFLLWMFFIIPSSVITIFSISGCVPNNQSNLSQAHQSSPAVLKDASVEMLANGCAGCHGTNGISTGPATPTIAGLDEEYFIEVMQAYKSGNRYSTIMWRIVRGYTNAEISNMAAYFSKIPTTSVTQNPAPNNKLARAGETIHKKYCDDCHNRTNTSKNDIKLSGQWAPYLRWTMHDYANGENYFFESEMKKAFNEVLDTYGEDGFQALAQYYAGNP